MSRVLFWGSLGLLGWAYAGYPATVAAAARLRPFRLRPTEPGPELVTVGIAARDEQPRIEERIRDILAQAVPFELEVIVASDGSTDGMDGLVARLAADDGRIRLLSLPRGGQSQAQNAIFGEARGQVVVLTDAGTRFSPGCLAALVAPFGDPRVGCTTGRIEWDFLDDTALARHEGLYWRYERRVRRLESDAGWLSTGTGAVLAVRRDAFREADASSPTDLLLALHVREQGRHVVGVNEAVAWDQGLTSLEATFDARARMATQGIRANLAMAPRLTPWRHPSAFLATWSHKLLRYATPWLTLSMAWAAGRLVRRGHAAYAAPLAAMATGIGLATTAAIAPRRAAHIPGAGACLTIVVVQAAFARGWLDQLRGRRIASWDPHGR